MGPIMAIIDDSKPSESDGSWFLEAVGAIPPAPTPSETVAALELDNTSPHLPVIPSSGEGPTVSNYFDGDTGTSNEAFTPVVDVPLPPEFATSEMDLPVAVTQPAEVEDTVLSPILASRRSFRWGTMALVVLLALVALLAAVWMPAALQQDATIVKQSYADASYALRQELPEAQVALDSISNPASSSDALSGALPGIGQLDSAALELSIQAAEPLPRTWPLLPSTAVDDLAPLRDAALIYASLATEIARQLGFAYVYRTTIPQLFDTGDLPVTADSRTISSLSLTLASTLVADSSALADLPTTEATADVNNDAHTLVERFGSWQDEYLTSLEDGDEAATDDLLEEFAALKEDLLKELEEAMTTIRIDLDGQIVTLAADLDRYLATLTQS